MKSKIINGLLMLTSLVGYLEWGGNNSAFLFAAEAEIIGKLFRAPLAVVHPLILLPLAGQLILLFTLFQRQVSKRLTYIGIACLSLLFLLILLIAIIGGNIRMLLSALPFLGVSFYAIRFLRSRRT